MTIDRDRAIDELRAELASLRQTVTALAADNADLRARLERPAAIGALGHSADTVPAEAPPVVPAVLGGSADGGSARPADRRTFLRGGALAAGALAAGVASVAGASPAAAANDDPLLVGATTFATRPTSLSVNYSQLEPSTVRVGLTVADGAVPTDRIAPAALRGYASGTSLRFGVQGTTDAEEAAGVYGEGPAGQSVGVFGVGNEAGVYAIGQKTGITAEASEGIGVDIAGATASLRLRTRETDETFDAEDHVAGEVMSRYVGDGTAELWFCVEAGTPGTWRRLASPVAAGTLSLFPETIRLYDSRPGNPPDSGLKTKLTGATSPRTITLPVSAGALESLSAILVNLTVVNTSAGGFVALHKGGTTWPGNSSINWTAPNTVIANAATVALDDQGRFEITCAAGASTDIIVDLIGSYL